MRDTTTKVQMNKNRIQKKFLVSTWVTFILICIVSLCHAQKAKVHEKKPLIIRFQNTVDSQLLERGNTYHNPFGEEYTIKIFKYYISNIAFKGTDGKTTLSKGPYLVNEADSSSKMITISAAENSFKSISFTIGVDSIYNVSGTHTGDLDPAKGMFWEWNSGYVMAKLEVTSPLSQEPNNNATYHIGGFKTRQNVERLVTLDLLTGNDSITNKGIKEIVIRANANKWFSGAHTIKIVDQPLCTTPGKLAMQFADNYAQMFTIAFVY